MNIVDFSDGYEISNNLKKLNDLKKYEIVSIIPHDNVDVDAILSSILFSKLLDFLRVSNEIIVFDKKISKDTLYVLDLFGIDITRYMVDKELERRNLFLIDHYKSIHSGHIVGCIDHHPNSEVLDYIIYDNRKTCATACTIYRYMLEVGMPVDSTMVEMLAYAMLVDTSGFLSNKTVKEETLGLLKLLEEYGLDYGKIRDISCLYTDIYNMSINEITYNGLKTYNFKRGKINASYSQLKGCIDEEMKNNILINIRDIVISERLLLWIFIVYALEEEKTYVYIVFHKFMVSIVYKGILSRGNDIMPIFEKMYN